MKRYWSITITQSGRGEFETLAVVGESGYSCFLDILGKSILNIDYCLVFCVEITAKEYRRANNIKKTIKKRIAGMF